MAVTARKLAVALDASAALSRVFLATTFNHCPPLGLVALMHPKTSLFNLNAVATLPHAETTSAQAGKAL
jgi:hypothetical protein